MKFLITSALVIFISSFAQASNFYVRPTAAGANTGADWNNAFSLSSIRWASILPGDTVWLAGGNYSTALTVSASGTSGHPVTIQRVRTTDTVPTQAAGWSSSFDSQVNITASPGINVPGSNFVTIDGRINYGILLTLPSGGGNGIVAASSASVDNLRLLNIDVLGPYCTTAKPCSTAAYGINIAPSANHITNMLINNCRVRGISEALRSSNWSSVVIEYTTIQDTDNEGVDHEDVMYSYPSSNVTFRYNKIFNSPNDGVFFEFGGAVNFYFYGNLYYNSSSSFVTTKAPGAYGPLYICNNTFQAPSSSSYGWITSNGSTINPNSEVYNNVFYNVSNGMGVTKSGYNAYNYTSLNGYSWPSSEPGSVTFTGSPFVNLSTYDFHLTSTSPLIGRGKALTADGFINKDIDGNTRGADGLWDIGAYEYHSGASPTPAPTPTPTLPSIASFTASPASITAGQTSTLSFSTSGASSLVINPGSINVLGKTSTTVTPSTTTTYTLTVTNSAGSVSKTVAVAGTTAPVAGWTFCANENAVCSFTGTKSVRYGANGTYVIKTFTNGVTCSNTAFGGDPLVNVVKSCYVASDTTKPSQSLFTTQTPASLADSDGVNVNYELGMRFTSTAAGQIKSIRFYKSSKETGTHTGEIYSTRGAVLAQVTFTNETASGWQVMNLATPLSIAANTEYTVSVNTGATYYVDTTSGLAAQVSSTNLKSVVGNNGVYGPVGARPTSSFSNTNYFRDVIFVPN